MQEKYEPSEIGVKKNCTVVIFCDDQMHDVFEDKNRFIIEKPGKPLSESARSYAHLHKGYLFQKHREHCDGHRKRTHRLTLRFEIEDFKHIFHVSIGQEQKNGTIFRRR